MNQAMLRRSMSWDVLRSMSRSWSGSWSRAGDEAYVSMSSSVYRSGSVSRSWSRFLSWSWSTSTK